MSTFGWAFLIFMDALAVGVFVFWPVLFLLDRVRKS